MPTSTLADVTPRFLLREREQPVHHRYRGLDEPHAHANGLCSPAGLHRRPWLERLRRALRRDLFVLHYQPIVSVSDGSVSHYEALLRLADEPDGRLVAPASFLPAAERYGLIREIDRMVLDKVTALLGGRHGDGGMNLAVNLSALSVTDTDMLGHIEERLARHRVRSGRLVIEITETAAISDMRCAKAFCADVQALGCPIALDDFGAGFGSFQYLKHLPFTYLKIDGDFIRRLPASREDQLVVQALVGVVRGLGRRTIAEFVGDEPTMRLLRGYGVDYAQGFEVGRPHPLVPLAA
ncbi:MAG TPA: EAL domain-containing protein [Solirubrobacteraceae bacterium]|jgi:EAL domain-containing protein (putative c-di-GMP-specific phosphodiesterase class I)